VCRGPLCRRPRSRAGVGRARTHRVGDEVRGRCRTHQTETQRSNQRQAVGIPGEVSAKVEAQDEEWTQEFLLRTVNSSHFCVLF